MNCKIIIALCLLGCGLAQAQSYTVQKPGKQPTYVNQGAGGGYTITTPGKAPTYVPAAGGGYTVSKPGEAPVYIRPSVGDGTVDQKQPPVHLFMKSARDIDQKAK